MARRKATRRKTGATRYFVLQTSGKDTKHVFTGRQPRQAALKAATRGFTNIVLRERGRKRLHIFTGTRKRVKAPANAPAWMRGKQIWKSNVKKKGIKHI
ncbi:chromosomal protein MC1 [Candidatus Woesearchaeota archaeon]|jgi:hypothetical protein|nr:chromosomal protein MC1 [Candidatus Woesearchaeota archaeon]MBT4114648.1 chromosomal protein MC1 [Candidatus Woesearchaeota archaeon]MBT4248068.1 chromosomal protein MC1 [Candidatus Woesearchaeota archaeon]